MSEAPPSLSPARVAPTIVRSSSPQGEAGAGSAAAAPPSTASRPPGGPSLHGPAADHPAFDVPVTSGPPLGEEPLPTLIFSSPPLVDLTSTDQGAPTCLSVHQSQAGANSCSLPPLPLFSRKSMDLALAFSGKEGLEGGLRPLEPRLVRHHKRDLWTDLKAAAQA